MAKNKLYWLKDKKRGEKEGKKREKERKKRKKKEKREEKEKEKERKKGVGEAIRNQKENTGEYLLILYTLSPLTSPGTWLFSWYCGGGSYCADFQVLALGGAPLPLPGEALSGGCLPHEAQGGTTPVAVARSENRYSALQ